MRLKLPSLAMLTLASFLALSACSEKERTYGGGFATQRECLEGHIFLTEGDVTAVELAATCEVSVANATAALADEDFEIESRAEEDDSLANRSLLSRILIVLACVLLLALLVAFVVWGAVRQRAWKKLVRNFPGETIVLDQCRYLGGRGVRLMEKGSYHLIVDTESLAIYAHTEERMRIALDEIRAVDLSGPGAYAEGGGFIGGGTDAGTAAQGIATASVLNALTTRKKIKTVIRIEAGPIELFFEHNKATPEQLRITLSPILGEVHSSSSPLETHSVPATSNPPPGSPDPDGVPPASTSRQFCVHCGTSVSISDARYCGTCGRELPRT